MLFFLLWLFRYMGLSPPPVYSVRWVWYPTQQPHYYNESDLQVEGQALGACTLPDQEDAHYCPRRESARAIS